MGNKICARMEKKKKGGRKKRSISIDLKQKQKKRWKARQIKNGNSWATPKKKPLKRLSLSFCQRRLFAVGFTLSRPLKDIWLCAQLIVECTFRLPKLNGSTSNWDVATKIHFYPPFKTFKPFFFFSPLCRRLKVGSFEQTCVHRYFCFELGYESKLFFFLSVFIGLLLGWRTRNRWAHTHTHSKQFTSSASAKTFVLCLLVFFLGVSTREEVGAQFFVLLTKSQ